MNFSQKFRGWILTTPEEARAQLSEVINRKDTVCQVYAALVSAGRESTKDELMIASGVTRLSSFDNAVTILRASGLIVSRKDPEGGYTQRLLFSPSFAVKKEEKK